MSGSAGIGPIDRRLDDPLGECRHRGDGVAFVGPDIPIEILLATGRPFGHLPWRADGSTPWADQWLESSFPFWARSILEQWHEGVFDGHDVVVFSRAGDASQRLYYYIAELKRRGRLGGPPLRIFDPAYVPCKSSLSHTAAAVSQLMLALDVSTGMLLEGIESANRLRRRIADLESERVANGTLYERLARAALWSDATQWIYQVEIPVAPVCAGRVLLAGSMPPDARIHQAVDAAGASIVAEAHTLCAGRLGTEFGLTEEPLAWALARHLRRVSIAPRAFFDRAAWIVERATAVRASAVVIWLTREDEVLAWSVPAMHRALGMAGLPALLLPAARWQADDGVLERIASFSREHAHASA